MKRKTRESTLGVEDEKSMRLLIKRTRTSQPNGKLSKSEHGIGRPSLNPLRHSETVIPAGSREPDPRGPQKTLIHRTTLDPAKRNKQQHLMSIIRAFSRTARRRFTAAGVAGS